jgi:hypothetical protein
MKLIRQLTRTQDIWQEVIVPDSLLDELPNLNAETLSSLDWLEWTEVWDTIEFAQEPVEITEKLNDVFDVDVYDYGFLEN